MKQLWPFSDLRVTLDNYNTASLALSNGWLPRGAIETRSRARCCGELILRRACGKTRAVLRQEISKTAQKRVEVGIPEVREKRLAVRIHVYICVIINKVGRVFFSVSVLYVLWQNRITYKDALYFFTWRLLVLFKIHILSFCYLNMLFNLRVQSSCSIDRIFMQVFSWFALTPLQAPSTTEAIRLPCFIID